MVLQIVIAAGLALLLTAAATLTLVRLSWSSRPATLLGGLLVPTMIFLWSFYDVFFNLEVGDPPPGMLLIGGLVLLAVLTPCTLFVSFLTARIAAVASDQWA